MSENQGSVPFESLPEDRRNAIKTFVNGTKENISKMNSEQRESMTTICYQQLEPELREIDFKAFNCDSYFEFLCRLVLAAAYVDKNFSLEEEEAADEIMKTIGLLGQPYDVDIENINRVEFDLVKLSGMLKPESRGMLLTFVSLIFLADKELAGEEYDMMIKILTP